MQGTHMATSPGPGPCQSARHREPVLTSTQSKHLPHRQTPSHIPGLPFGSYWSQPCEPKELVSPPFPELMMVHCAGQQRGQKRGQNPGQGSEPGGWARRQKASEPQWPLCDSPLQKASHLHRPPGVCPPAMDLLHFGAW